jgi:ABC-type glycerol-3-phosphate transport system substrate-binding protein
MSGLTPYLSGDAIKGYPNLAHYTNYTRRSGVVGNKTYAMPVARPPIGTVLQYRKDLLDAAGITDDMPPKTRTTSSGSCKQSRVPTRISGASRRAELRPFR